MVDEADGSWGTAQQVTGLAALGAGGDAGAGWVSCASVGDCAASGYYTDSSGNTQAFVVDEVGGSWGAAQQIPGLAALNTGGDAWVGSVSCAPAGICAAGGYYTDSSGHQQAFVVDEKWVTSTVISLSPSSVTYGSEQSEQVSVAVSPASGGGTPTGTVSVTASGASGPPVTVCTVTLAAGAGSCAPQPALLPAGGYQVSASYSGDADFGPSVSAAQALTVEPAAAYQPAGPARIMDTRDGTGGITGPLGPGQAVALPVAGHDGVPADATAVVLNVTATGGTRAGYVTVYPDGQARPLASNLNFTAGETIPNLVVVPLTDGKVDFYNYAGDVNLIADLAGYYTTSGGSLYTTAGPVRVMDTRNGTGGITGPVGPGQAITLQVAGQHGVPADATAVVLNVTATGGTKASYVTVYPDGQARPLASSLNFTAGETIPNLVVVPLTDGKIDFYNYTGNVNLIADLAGYYTTPAG